MRASRRSPGGKLRTDAEHHTFAWDSVRKPTLRHASGCVGRARFWGRLTSSILRVHALQWFMHRAQKPLQRFDTDCTALSSAVFYSCCSNARAASQQSGVLGPGRPCVRYGDPGILCVPLRGSCNGKLPDTTEGKAIKKQRVLAGKGANMDSERGYIYICVYTYNTHTFAFEYVCVHMYMCI